MFTFSVSLFHFTFRLTRNGEFFVFLVAFFSWVFSRIDLTRFFIVRKQEGKTVQYKRIHGSCGRIPDRNNETQICSFSTRRHNRERFLETSWNIHANVHIILSSGSQSSFSPQNQFQFRSVCVRKCDILAEPNPATSECEVTTTSALRIGESCTVKDFERKNRSKK